MAGETERTLGESLAAARPDTVANQNAKGATPFPEHCAASENRNYSVVLPAFFALAHLAFANAESLALPAAEIFFEGLRPAWACAAIRFATPARMLASPSALIFHLPFFAGLAASAACFGSAFAHLAC